MTTVEWRAGAVTLPGEEFGIERLDATDPPYIGSYRLLGRLGAGGMGRVYLGISPGERLAAVKLVHEEYATDPEFRARFRLETRAARAVSGAFTAPVLEADPEAERPWLAALYVPALTLQEAIASLGPMPVPAVRALGAALAEALRAIHSAGLVHRDLKPGNVLLTASGPLVIDFGISRALDGTRVTRTGTLIGTVGYMAPEQLRSDSAPDPAGDVFALGCVLAFAACAEPPFGTGRADEIALRVVREDPRLVHVPAELHPLIASCLEKDPDARTSTDRLLAELAPADISALTHQSLLRAVSARAHAASELAAQVTASSGSVTSVPVPMDLAAPVEPRRLTRRKILALAGGGVGAAVGGGLALAGVFDGSNALPGPQPSWTASISAWTQMSQALKSSQMLQGFSAFELQTSIALVGSRLVSVGSVFASAFGPSSGAQLWSWNSLSANSGRPVVPGTVDSYPCGVTSRGIYGWAVPADFGNASLFTADASGAVTGSWAVDDSGPAGGGTDSLGFCARVGGMAVFAGTVAPVSGIEGAGIDRVIAFDLKTGALAWSLPIQSIGTMPAYYTTYVTADAQRVYVQDSADTYALDPATGTTLWHVVSTAPGGVPTQLALVNGRLLVGSTHVTALRPQDGDLLWQSADDSASRNVTAQAAAYQGSYISLLSVVGSMAYLCDGSSEVFAIDTASGATRWTYSNQNLRPVAAGTYQPTNGFASSHLVAVPIGGSSRTAPAGSFIALSPDTGTPLGTYTLPASSGGSTPWQLIVADASVYAATGGQVCGFEGGS